MAIESYIQGVRKSSRPKDAETFYVQKQAILQKNNFFLTIITCSDSCLLYYTRLKTILATCQEFCLVFLIGIKDLVFQCRKHMRNMYSIEA